jgi:hypothetical protein
MTLSTQVVRSRRMRMSSWPAPLHDGWLWTFAFRCLTAALPPFGDAP